MIRVEKSLGYIKYFLGFPIQLRSLSSHKIRGLGLGFPRKGVRAISGIPESRVSFPIVRLQGQDAISAVQITWDVLFRQGVDSSAFSGNVYVADSKREDLPHDVPRPVSYSWVKWRVPLKTNSILKDQFRLFHSDRIRIGKILELLDAFSADVAYRHVGGNMEEYTIVTACLDRLDFFDKLMYEEDLDLEGFMVRVGSSSMDVRVMISSVRGGYIGKADFLLVSREKFKEKSKPVPKLLLVNDEEKQLEHLATINRELKRRQELNSVWKVPPTSDESRVMHYLFKQSQNSLSRSYSRQASISSSTKVFSPEAGTEVGYVCMASTRISKSTIAQLQNRNVHNKIFGGYLTREAYELAWICAYRFGKNLPQAQHMDDIVFLRPVEIGSIITFTAEVVFSSSLSQTALVNVEAVVEDPASGNRSLTNEFNFEFSFNELQHQIYPESYFDAMKFISGRRTFHSMSAPEIY